MIVIVNNAGRFQQHVSHMGKKIHTNVYGPVRGRGIWRVGTNEQFCNLHRGTLTGTDIQVTRLELLGNLIRMEIH